MRHHIFTILAFLAVSACRGEEESPQGRPSETPAAPLPPAIGDLPNSLSGGARQVVEQTDLFQFEYSYPQGAGAVAELATLLDARLIRERDNLVREAIEGQSNARDDGFPFNKYSSETVWEVVADLPDWLSLSADVSSYTGGAHPNYGFDTLVWDKQRKVALAPIDFFISPAALDEVLGEELCKALNAERANRRGEAVPENSQDLFDACVKMDETNILLGSQGDSRFNRIGVQIAPYLAGPYAEGAYEFTFPVTQQVLKSVRGEYREAFSARN